MTTEDEPRDPTGLEPDDDHEPDDVVARVREELAAARRRVRDAWLQYERRAAADRARQAIALPPLLARLLELLS